MDAEPDLAKNVDEDLDGELADLIGVRDLGGGAVRERLVQRFNRSIGGRADRRLECQYPARRPIDDRRKADKATRIETNVLSIDQT
jgi:predicted secreted protein